MPQVQSPQVQLPQAPPLPPRMQIGGRVKEITYDDIQEKLKILDNPALLCSPAGKGLVKEVKSDPILGLVSELFNIPPPDTLDKVCPVALTMTSFDAAEELDLEEALPAEAVAPVEPVAPVAPVTPVAPVEPAVPQVGGRKTKKMNKSKRRKSRKHGHRRH